MTKTRTEHLTDADKEKTSPRSPIQSFLNIAEVEEKQNSPSSSEEVNNLRFLSVLKAKIYTACLIQVWADKVTVVE